MISVWNAVGKSEASSWSQNTSVTKGRVGGNKPKNCWIILPHLPPQFRDDNKKLHPCLVDFQSLPEPERNYNLQMSGETLKWVCNKSQSNVQRRRIMSWGTNVNPSICIPKDSLGTGLPCWYGWWESRGEPKEDQIAQDVRLKKKRFWLFKLQVFCNL